MLKNIIVTTRIDNPAQELSQDLLKAKTVAVIPDLFATDEAIIVFFNVDVV
ncbi:hypothetical protein PHSC3_000976 [Chlamydiales bacterium STE3]|nr:hypothetical protein PHSC3_000976 [Chlamydiales bacterium STE3]